MDELIGVVVPVYNVEKYLEECIESLLKQTYRNLEIILINDGSTDSSFSIIEKYQKQDRRIVGINRENKGSIYTRLEGAKISKAKYIMFIDSDDWLEHDAIEKSYTALKKHKADLVKFNMVKEFINEGRKRYIPGPFDMEKCIQANNLEKEFYPIVLNTYHCNSLCAQLIKKELINNVVVNDYSIRMGDDLLCNLDVLKEVKTVVFINEFLYHYRHTQNSLTTLQEEKRIKSNISDTYIVYNKLFDELKAWNIDTKFYREIVQRRIIREMINILLPIFLTSEKNKKDYCKYSREMIEDNKITLDFKKLSYEEQLFMRKKYSVLLLLANFKYRLPAILKGKIKEILKIWNLRRKK